jgi:hypothetical protein
VSVTVHEELGGGIDETTGQRGRSLLDPFHLAIPSEVRLAGDRVEWRDSNAWRTSTEGLLDEFMRLGTPASEPRWGGIELCELHLYPLGHDTRPGDEGCPRIYVHSDWRSVAVDAMTRIAKQSLALFGLAMDFHQQEVGRAESWQALRDSWTWSYPWHETDWVPEMCDYFLGVDGPVSRALGSLPFRQSHRDLDHQRSTFAEIMSLWLDLAGARVVFTWGGERPHVLVGNNGVFGNLAVQLMWAVTARRGASLCSGCGLTYQPKRAPRLGESHYCAACRSRGIPNAERSRKRRKKERILALRDRGLSWVAIGHKVQVDPTAARQLVQGARRRRTAK